MCTGDIRKARGMEAIGLLRANDLTDNEAKQLHTDLIELFQLCDELDCEDAFGTEGWKHNIGWED